MLTSGGEYTWRLVATSADGFTTRCTWSGPERARVPAPSRCSTHERRVGPPRRGLEELAFDDVQGAGRPAVVVERDALDGVPSDQPAVELVVGDEAAEPALVGRVMASVRQVRDRGRGPGRRPAVGRARGRRLVDRACRRAPVRFTGLRVVRRPTRAGRLAARTVRLPGGEAVPHDATRRERRRGIRTSRQRSSNDKRVSSPQGSFITGPADCMGCDGTSKI